MLNNRHVCHRNGTNSKHITKYTILRIYRNLYHFLPHSKYIRLLRSCDVLVLYYCMRSARVCVRIRLTLDINDMFSHCTANVLAVDLVDRIVLRVHKVLVLFIFLYTRFTPLLVYFLILSTNTTTVTNIKT